MRTTTFITNNDRNFKLDDSKLNNFKFTFVFLTKFLFFSAIYNKNN